MTSRSVFGNSEAAVWMPEPEAIARSRLARFMAKQGFATLAELHSASVTQADWFTRAAAADLKVELHGSTERVVDTCRGRAFPRWFPDATMNVAESCLDRHANNPASANRVAVVCESDDGRRHALSFAALRREADKVAADLTARGIGKGDRVVLFTPPLPEAAAVILGCAKIGVIVVPAFSGYGPEPLAARINASQAVAVFTVDATTRKGKVVPMKKVVDEAATACPSLRHVFIIGASSSLTPGRDILWSDMAEPLEPVIPLQLDPNDPLFIIFTSGTTGKPKGIVHSHIGYLLKSAIDFGYAFDLQSDDTLAWITDMGWMLGPLMVIGGLHLGCSLVMIEGLPNHPDEGRLWEIVERNRATMLGVAPTAARGLRAAGVPIEADLSSLRAFASTGEAWDLPSWRWLFEEVGGARLPIINYSGGTETGGGILSCYTIAPQSPASFGGPLLGMSVDVFDSEGQPTNGVGELVVRNIWAGMTHSFWEDDARYLETYWSRWADIWVHGDLASVDSNGFWHIHGRSDDTLKVSGRRVGPAEIESALVAIEGVAEAAVIGIPDAQRGQAIIAFVAAKQGAKLDGYELIQEAGRLLGKGMTPSAMHLVSMLPKTRNGKIMRRVIRARYLGEPAGDLSALDPATPLDSIPQMRNLVRTSK